MPGPHGHWEGLGSKTDTSLVPGEFMTQGADSMEETQPDRPWGTEWSGVQPREDKYRCQEQAWHIVGAQGLFP